MVRATSWSVTCAPTRMATCHTHSGSIASVLQGTACWVKHFLVAVPLFCSSEVCDCILDISLLTGIQKDSIFFFFLKLWHLFILQMWKKLLKILNIFTLKGLSYSGIQLNLVCFYAANSRRFGKTYSQQRGKADDDCMQVCTYSNIQQFSHCSHSEAKCLSDMKLWVTIPQSNTEKAREWGW